MNLPNRSSWTQCDHNSTYFAVPTAQVGRAHQGTGVNVVGTYPTYLCYVTNRKLEWVYSFWRQCCAEMLQDNKQKHSDWIKGWIQILKWKFLSGSVLIAVLSLCTTIHTTMVNLYDWWEWLRDALNLFCLERHLLHSFQVHGMYSMLFNFFASFIFILAWHRVHFRWILITLVE